VTDGSGRTVVAAFDFDGTITYRDTLFAFLLHLAGPWRLVLHSIPLLPVLTGYALKIIPNGAAKERVLSRFLSGMPEKRLQESAERFARANIPALVRKQALERLAWHRSQGHRCVVVSASIEDYVAPWASRAGFDDVIATRLQRDNDGRLTGCYDGKNCYGPEKVRRLRDLLGNVGQLELYAYGDSRGDRELLELADHAYFRKMPGMNDGD
jgi:HAD superfamily hydrolase (TIGR01490 family)